MLPKRRVIKDLILAVKEMGFEMGFEVGLPKRRQGWRAIRCYSDSEVILRLEYLE